MGFDAAKSADLFIFLIVQMGISKGKDGPMTHESAPGR